MLKTITTEYTGEDVTHSEELFGGSSVESAVVDVGLFRQVIS